MDWKQKAKEAADLAVFGVLVGFTVMAVVCAKPQLIGGNGAYMVLGNSMQPLFSAGDMVLTKEAAQIQLGDVIAFRGTDGRVISHRVIEKSDWYRTKGDANEDADTWIVPPEGILGEYWFRIPRLGYVVAFVKTKYFLLFVSLPIGFYLLVTRAWDTYDVLTKAREATAEVSKRTYWWLRRLIWASTFRGMWWARLGRFSGADVARLRSIYLELVL